VSAFHWYLLIGGLLLLIALVGKRVARWPMTTAMIYLVIGYLLGTLGALRLDLPRDARWLEIASEIAVTVSLFSAGLKFRSALTDRRWRLPVMLATLGMLLTVALVAGAGMLAFAMPLGAAIVLGAILAPTDPVLASDVQLVHGADADPVRGTLTGEAGLNDGTAFPVLLLGLGLLGQYELGAFGWRWLVVDVVWQVLGGLAIGAGVGVGVARLVVHLRRHHGEASGYDDFLALGVIGLAYGIAHVAHTYGFLAVFAAGWALHAGEHVATAGPGAARSRPAPLADSVLRFNDHIDRIAELALVLLVGALAASLELQASALAFAAFVFFVARPLAVAPLCIAARLPLHRVALVSWFGIRGIGSVYYLAHAIGQGLPAPWIEPITTLVLALIVSSLLLHGITCTPAMLRWSSHHPLRDGAS
jgi:sodium/hydrogen antiporter